MIGHRPFREGDFVIYRKTKHSPTPGPRAERVTPAEGGDDYVYNVDKFWVVDRITPDDQLVLRTRRGKQHTTSTGDPNLRRAGLIERLLYRGRFPQPSADAADQPLEVNAG